MKKAIIATAAVLVLSFISTVCFGVALGSQGLHAFFRDGGVLDDWKDATADWDDVIVYAADLADTDDQSQLFASESVEISAVDTLKITAPCGNVRVRRGTGEKITVTLEQYSARVNASSKYTVTIPQDGEIQLSAASDISGVAAVLTVYVPQPLAALTVDAQLGEVDIRDITAEVLTVNLSTGDLDLAACTLNNANLRVSTGDIDIKNTVSVAEKLVLDCACGDADLELPATAPFTLRYTVQTGDVELQTELPSEWTRSVQRNGVSCKGEIQHTGADGETGGLYEVTLNLGNLEIGGGTHSDDD